MTGRIETDESTPYVYRVVYNAEGYAARLYGTLGSARSMRTRLKNERWRSWPVGYPRIEKSRLEWEPVD